MAVRGVWGTEDGPLSENWALTPSCLSSGLETLIKAFPSPAEATLALITHCVWIIHQKKWYCSVIARKDEGDKTKISWHRLRLTLAPLPLGTLPHQPQQSPAATLHCYRMSIKIPHPGVCYSEDGLI